MHQPCAFRDLHTCDVQHFRLLLLLRFAGHHTISTCIRCRRCAPAHLRRLPRSCPASAGLTGAAAAAWRCKLSSTLHGRASGALAGLRQRSLHTQTWTAWRCVLFTSGHLCQLPEKAVCSCSMGRHLQLWRTGRAYCARWQRTRVVWPCVLARKGKAPPQRRHGGHPGRLRLGARCAHHGKRMPQCATHKLVRNDSAYTQRTALYPRQSAFAAAQVECNRLHEAESASDTQVLCRCGVLAVRVCDAARPARRGLARLSMSTCPSAHTTHRCRHSRRPRLSLCPAQRRPPVSR